MNLNHIGNCPDCGGQGLLEIVRTKDRSKFLVMCDECGLQWHDPNSAINNPTATIKMSNRYNETEEVTIDEIKSIGWENYLVVKDQ
jgi:uncharacterized Zn finger protein